MINTNKLALSLDDILDNLLDEFDQSNAIRPALVAIQATAAYQAPVERFINTDVLGIMASFLELSEIRDVVTHLENPDNSSQVISHAFAEQMGSRFVNNNTMLTYQDYLVFIQEHAGEAVFPTIVGLNLSNANIDDHELKAIVDQCPKLTSLNLSKTKITDEGLKHLRGAPLQSLDISDCNIEGNGLAHLNKNLLTFLNLKGTQINLSHAMTLQLRFPKLRFESDVKLY